MLSRHTFFRHESHTFRRLSECRHAWSRPPPASGYSSRFFVHPAQLFQSPTELQEALGRCTFVYFTYLTPFLVAERLSGSAAGLPITLPRFTFIPPCPTRPRPLSATLPIPWVSPIPRIVVLDMPPNPLSLKQRLAALSANINSPSRSSSFDLPPESPITSKRKAFFKQPFGKSSSIAPGVASGQYHGQERIQEVMNRLIFQAGVDYE